MTVNSAEMKRLTSGLGSKSAKMRALARAGYKRADIARFLGTNYQFVRNVLLREEARMNDNQKRADADAKVESASATRKMRLGADGQVNIPQHLQDALGLKEGDVLIGSAENGELHLLTIDAAVRRAQAIVRRFVPEGVSLVDELLEDRRREVERERQNG